MERSMQIDGNNNIQVNGNLNISGDLPVSKKALKKLIRKELDNMLLKKFETKKVTYSKSLESPESLIRSSHALVNESTLIGQKNGVLYIETYTAQKSVLEVFLKNIRVQLRTKKSNQKATSETMLQSLFDTEMIFKNIQSQATCIFHFLNGYNLDRSAS